MLLSTILFAAKQEKELVCHVGNEVGPGGEVFLDDPGCAPIEENNYFCPDAGKIDLISVAKVSKHLDKSSHTFDGISDYRPADVGASGEGNEDSDGDGIDDGCQPPVECPCWSQAGLDSLRFPVAGDDLNNCRKDFNGPGTTNNDEWRLGTFAAGNALVVSTLEQNGAATFPTCEVFFQSRSSLIQMIGDYTGGTFLVIQILGEAQYKSAHSQRCCRLAIGACTGE